MRSYEMFWAILFVIVIVFLILSFSIDANAESAIIPFTSAEDLIARTDSVIAVCDTVWREVSRWADGSIAHGIFVHHRTLVGVMKYSDPKWSKRFPTKMFRPGEAIVWWEWEVE